MKVLVTGGETGQLKWELGRTVPAGVEWVGAQQARLDITDREKVLALVQETKPECIINAAAYTAVDAAEENPEPAFAVNDIGVKNLCDAAALVNSRLVHVSTDFVFGASDGRPLTATSVTDPSSVYGASKLAGENHVLKILPATGVVLRTAWVYSSFGNNFVKTMLRLMGERESVGVIADQVGSPTWANGLARALWKCADVAPNGVLQWTGAGAATWFDFAMAIYEEGRASGLLEKEVTVTPLRTDQYPTPATRPPYSVMEITHTAQVLNLQPQHWRVELRNMMREIG